MKNKIDKHRYVTFLNDEDGVSAKDYLLLISTIVFFGFMIVGLVLILFGIPISDDYIKLLDIMDTPLMTIICGTMSINVAEKIVEHKKPKESQNNNKYNEENKYE